MKIPKVFLPLATLLIAAQALPADIFLNSMLQMYPQTAQKIKILSIKLQPEIQKAVTTFKSHFDIATKLTEPRFAKLGEQLADLPLDNIVREAMALREEVAPPLLEFLTGVHPKILKSIGAMQDIATETVESTKPHWDALLAKVGPTFQAFYREHIEPELAKSELIVQDIIGIVGTVGIKYAKVAEKHFDSVEKELGPLVTDILGIVLKELGREF